MSDTGRGLSADEDRFTAADQAVLDRLAELPVEDYRHVDVREADDDE